MSRSHVKKETRAEIRYTHTELYKIHREGQMYQDSTSHRWSRFKFCCFVPFVTCRLVLSFVKNHLWCVINQQDNPAKWPDKCDQTTAIFSLITQKYKALYISLFISVDTPQHLSPPTPLTHIQQIPNVSSSSVHQTLQKNKRHTQTHTHILFFDDVKVLSKIRSKMKKKLFFVAIWHVSNKSLTFLMRTRFHSFSSVNQITWK